MAAVAHPSRPAFRRNSPLAGFGPNGFSADAPMIKRIDVGDDSDSDDEPPPAITFSKVTQALLADAGVPSSPPRQAQAGVMPRFNRSTSAGTAGLDTPSRVPGLKVVRRSSPSSTYDQKDRNTPLRVVHLGAKGPSSAKRSISISGPYPHHAMKRDPTPETNSRSETVTPAPAPPGSTRVKRAPMTGLFLKSGPIRRGFSRSNDSDQANDEAPQGSSSQPSASSYTPQDNSRPPSRQRSREALQNSHQRAPTASSYTPQDNSRPRSRQRSREPLQNSHQRAPSASSYTPQDNSRPASRQRSREPLQNSHQRAPSYARANYRYDAPKIHTDAYEDQENLPPPTFKRDKDQDFKYLGKPSTSVLSDDEKQNRRHVDETPVLVSQQEPRRALGAISGNTPHRAAPAPPPKMSVLDAATSRAGASTTKTRKKRTHIVIKGKIFTQMGRIGKGGSSEVYCVMAENYKTFALKRVKLDDCDETAVRGYKGEIDLLKKLTDVERVVRLYDWELNDDKKELLVLMEKGDTDFNRILTLRLNGTDARFDSVFTRYHWKEMLECVQAVHDYDIVHSDLKPANFLLVQGRLKLIDFGIANAIDTDNTVNVHRDSHVGTPNYMSPESITDTNATGRDDAGRPLKKDMRIGKASDVWSLGCILYQMAYGRPPFAHIGNQISRIMAITNPRHIIEFPELGVGDARIPSTLRGILRRCLNRDPEKRPLIKDMLSDSDVYLNPEGMSNAVLMDEALLGQILNKVLDRCRDPDRGVPSHDEAQIYPKSFMIKIREMQEGR